MIEDPNSSKPDISVRHISLPILHRTLQQIVQRITQHPSHNTHHTIPITQYPSHNTHHTIPIIQNQSHSHFSNSQSTTVAQETRPPAKGRQVNRSQNLTVRFPNPLAFQIRRGPCLVNRPNQSCESENLNVTEGFDIKLFTTFGYMNLASFYI